MGVDLVGGFDLFGVVSFVGGTDLFGGFDLFGVVSFVADTDLFGGADLFNAVEVLRAHASPVTNESGRKNVRLEKVGYSNGFSEWRLKG